MCAYGPNVLGYCDPDVDKAAIEQLGIANCTTAPSYKMVECAETLVDTVAMADWAFFMKNGTDATTFCVMLARAYTGKRKIFFLRNYYHGNDPWAMRADYPGILPEDVAHNVVVPWFDLQAMEAAYDAVQGRRGGADRPALRPRELLRQPRGFPRILAAACAPFATSAICC